MQDTTHTETTYLSPESGEFSPEEASTALPEDSTAAAELPGTPARAHPASLPQPAPVPMGPSGVQETHATAAPPPEWEASGCMLAQIPSQSGAGSVPSTPLTACAAPQPLVGEGATDTPTACTPLSHPQAGVLQPQTMLSTPRGESEPSASRPEQQAGSVMQPLQSTCSSAYRSARHSTGSEEASAGITAHPLGVSAALSQELSAFSNGESTSDFATAPVAGTEHSAGAAISESQAHTEEKGSSAKGAEEPLNAGTAKCGRSPLQIPHLLHQPGDSGRTESLASASLMPPQTPTQRSSFDPLSHSSFSSKPPSHSGDAAHAEGGSPLSSAMDGGVCKLESYSLMKCRGHSAEGNNFRKSAGAAAAEAPSAPRIPVQRRTSTGDATSEEGMSTLSQEGFGLPGLPMSGSLLAGGMPQSVAGLLDADMSLGDLAGNCNDCLVVRTWSSPRSVWMSTHRRCMYA